MNGYRDWRQFNMCPVAQATHTHMFPAEQVYEEGNADRPGLGWLAVSVASFIDANTTVRIEVLGENNTVLARGATYTPGGTPAQTTRPAGTGTGTANPNAPKTGVAGIAVIGAVAILAAGSIAVSRKRSK
jgi:hypothetical protein